MLTISAFTTRVDIHWSVGLLGVAIETAGLFIVIQCLINYLLLAYPTNSASLLAGNDFMRSSLAASAIMFSNPLYARLGIRNGVIVLGSATIVCIFGMLALYLWGHRFRQMKIREDSDTDQLGPGHDTSAL